MTQRKTISMVFFTLPFCLLSSPAYGQTDSSAKATQQQPAAKDQKAEKKKSDRKLLKELGGPYRQWLEEDVVYIIMGEERKASLQLSTNEEREQFIEQFWLRRSPTPDSPDNDFKEEHYRRIAYANEHFASGIPGRPRERATRV